MSSFFLCNFTACTARNKRIKLEFAPQTVCSCKLELFGNDGGRQNVLTIRWENIPENSS